MKHHLAIAFSVLAVSATGVTAQQTDIEPEELVIKERISEGQHIYLMDFGMNDSSQIYVLNAEDLSLEGSIGMGSFGQMVMSPDKSTIYSGSDYMRRYTYGEVEAVVHEWDSATLNARREFIISNKMAQTLTQKGVLTLSADGNYLIVQNATPATSVNIVDLAAGKDLVEIPTPGCWTAYPTVGGNAFTTLCGDGTAAKYSYAADGTFGEPEKSDKIFDADTDPLFGMSVRVDGKLVYVSYGGTLHMVDDSGDKPVQTGTFTFAEEGWAPSGYNLMAYHEPSNTLFVLMHSNPSDGSHKYPAEAIWAIDMGSQKVVGKGEGHADTNIVVGQGDTPVLVSIDPMGGVHRYDVTLGDSVTITEAAAREGLMMIPTYVAVDF